MTALPLVLVTALMMGVVHAFDVDHLAAITTFIARRPSPGSAVAFAGDWATP
jgi:high-affinity nickel permease